jgi:hypothetical protein
MSLLRQVNAWLFDSVGTAIVLDKSGGIRITDNIQSALHDGNMYSFTNHGTIAAGASLILLVRIGYKQVHFDGFSMDISQSPFLIEMFEAPTVTTTGTLQTVSNRNRASANTPTMSLYTGAAVFANGTLIADDLLLIAGQGSNVLSGSSSIDNGWVLKANTDYIIKLTNQAGITTSYNTNLTWNEATYIV